MARHPEGMNGFPSDPLDVVSAFAGLVLAFSAIPQGVRVWRARSARDVSITTWVIIWASLFVLTVYTWMRVDDSFLRLQFALNLLLDTIVVAILLRFRKPR